jgi:hypothetical protein
MRFFAALPAYQSQVVVAGLHGLLESGGLFAGVYTPTGTANLPSVRNALVATFLSTPFDACFFIDADVGFQQEAVQKIMRHVMDGDHFVAGAIPYRNPELEDTPIYRPVPGVAACTSGYFPARYVACGFTCVHRAVFEKIIAAGLAPTYRQVSTGVRIHHFFPQPIVDGELLSEAYGLCHLAEKVGIPVMLDADCGLTHWGMWGFPR